MGGEVMGITASYLTLSGSAYGEPAKYSLLERAKAAHAAGISSIGMSLDDIIPDIVPLRYVKIPELEWLELSRRMAPDEIRKLLWATQYYGATRVNVGVTAATCSPARAAENLKRILDITVPLGMTVAVEPVAFGAMPLISDVRTILELSGASPDQAGLLYDWWQTSYDPENLFANPAGILPVVAEVQVCGFRDDDPGTDDPAVTSQDRNSLTLESPAAIAWLRDQLMAPGVPFSYELPNAWLRKLPLLKMAEAAAADMSLMS
jgi:sugar phosphate isomerase/epimerase